MDRRKSVHTRRRRCVIGLLTIFALALVCVWLTGCQCRHKEWREATCTSPRTCVDCGVTEGEALGHTGGTASCKERATCTRCGEAYGELSAHAWSDATCTSPKTCKTCGATEGAALGHTGGTASCKEGAKCTRCGETYGDKAAHTWRDATCTAPKTCTVCGVTEGEAAGHVWNDATCTSPKTCKTCGATEGEAAGHTWNDATCTAPKTCKTCGATEGKAAGHTWNDATCTAPKTCKTCGATEGEALGHTGGTASCQEQAVCTRCGEAYGALAEHSWSGATCSSPATCATCGAERGDSLGHAWREATCQAPRTCARCGATEGSVGEHAWRDATCVAPKTCKTCGKTEGAALSEHKWDAGTVKTPATCLQTGVRVHTCTVSGCGATKEETIALSEHDYEDTVVAATCTEAGYTIHVCRTCGDSYQDANTEIKNHEWDKDAVTCTEGRHCTRDGCDATEPAKGHSHVQSSHTDATCTEAEKTVYTCPDCGDSYTVTGAAAMGHDTEGVTPTERKVEGKTCEYVLVYACGREGCGASLEGATVFHHTYTVKVTKEPTCMSAGEKTYTCTCGDTKTEAIAKDTQNGHAWDEGTLDGTIRTYTCTHEGCGATRTVVDASAAREATVGKDDLNKTGEVQLKDATIALDENTKKQLEDGVTLSADTLDEAARAEATKGLSEAQKEQLGDKPIYNFTAKDSADQPVTRFDGKVTVTIPYTLQDGEDPDSISVWYIADDGTVEEIKDTVYSNGLITFTVEHFSHYTVTRLTPAERCAKYGHADVEKTFAPTCTEEGYTLLTCSRCHRTEKINPTAALGHEYKQTAAVAATCMTAGSVTYTCDHDGCGDSYTNPVPATGHRFDETPDQTVAPTCTATGTKTYYCKNDGCDGIRVTVQEKLAHSYETKVTAPTCTTKGYTTHTCGTCGDSYTDTFTDATGHSYRESERVEATCVKSGSVTERCETCGDTKVTSLPAHGKHNYENGACTMCGLADSVGCDHTTLHEETIRFADFGACGGGITIRRCDCGKVVRFSMDAMGDYSSCDLEGDDDGELLPDGSNRLTKTCATCGLRAVLLTTYTMEDVETCKTTEHYSLTLTIGDTVIVAGAEDEATYTHLERQIAVYHLADYGACGGDAKIFSCACGENKRFSMNMGAGCKWAGTSFAQTDENGCEHTGIHWVCQTCGLTRRQDEWTAPGKDCTAENHKSVTLIAPDGKTIVVYDKVTPVENHEQNWSFVFDDETKGCAGGVTGTWTCGKCGATGTEQWSDHEYVVVKTVDLSDYDICGDALTILTCACGQETYITYGCLERQYDGFDEYTDENGYTHEVSVSRCAECGATFTEDSYKVPLEGCYACVYTTITVKTADGKTVLDAYTYSATMPDHRGEMIYRYLTSDDCDLGWRALGRCSACGQTAGGMGGQGHTPLLVEQIDLTPYAICDGNAGVYACACGKIRGIGCTLTCQWAGRTTRTEDIDGVSHTIRTGICEKCGLKMVTDNYTEIVGCQVIAHNTIRYYAKDGTELSLLASDNISTREEHTAKTWALALDEGAEDCDGGWTATWTCTGCGASDTIHGSGHEVFPQSTTDLSDYAACGAKLVQESCACGKETWLDCEFNCTWSEETIEVKNDAGVRHIIRTRTCTKCGVKQVADSYDDEGGCTGITHLITKYYTKDGAEIPGAVCEETGTYERHANMELLSAKFDDEKNKSCEAGVTVTLKCADCGKTEERHMTWHSMYVKVIDLSGYKACDGATLEFGACACGESQNISWNGCEWGQKSEEKTDAEGKPYTLSTATCRKCGMRREIVRYEEKTGTCTGTFHGTVTFYDAEGTAIPGATCETSGTYERHDRMEPVSTKFDDEKNKSCEAGVTVTLKCADCGKTEEQHLTWHSVYKTERVDLSAYGCVCGGYFVRFACACGKNDGFRLDGLECDMTITPCELWREDACDGQKLSEAYIATCAVTDPACGFTYRYCNYYRESDTCLKPQYVVWQFGYDPETGKVGKEIVIPCGGFMEVHEKTEITTLEPTQDGDMTVTGQVETCTVCGSTTTMKWWRKDGELLRTEQVDEGSAKENSLHKKLVFIREYTCFGERRCVTYERTESTGWDDVVWWNETTTEYTDEYGCNYIKTSKYSDGKENSDSGSWHDEAQQTWIVTVQPTCTQPGTLEYKCEYCGFTKHQPLAPDHRWVSDGNGGYQCNVCGLENANGASGTIVMEDLTEKYGGGTSYVVGYYNRGDVKFTYYVSLILKNPAEGQAPDIILNGDDAIACTRRTDVCAYEFEASAVRAAAQAKGLEEGSYDVCFTFVPAGSEGSLDYALIFTTAPTSGTAAA